MLHSGLNMVCEIYTELLESKIKKAQEHLVKAKQHYDVAAAIQKNLFDKCYALRQKNCRWLLITAT